MKKLCSVFCTAICLLLTVLLGVNIYAADNTTEVYDIDLALVYLGEACELLFDPDFEENLSENESRLYAILSAEMPEKNTEIDISSCNYTDIEELQAFLQNVLNTEFMTISVSDKIKVVSENGVLTTIVIEYRETAAVFSRNRLTVQDGIDHALTEVNSSMSDLEKALVLHDYLVREVDYDPNELSDGEFTEESYTITGVFVNRIAVCQGYALAYSKLLKEVDITSMYIGSDQMDHGWTLIKLGNNWYHVDVTWDDPVGNNVKGGFVYHKYFLRSNTEFENEYSHYGWEPYNKGDTLPSASVSNSFPGYCFRPVYDSFEKKSIYPGIQNYIDGKFYSLSNCYGSNKMVVSKIDGSEKSEIQLAREYQYMFEYEGKLYANDSKCVYELGLDGSEKAIKAIIAEGAITNFWLKLDEFQYEVTYVNGTKEVKTVDIENGPDNIITQGEFMYAINDANTSVSVAVYIGNSENITVPTIVNGYPVLGVTSGFLASNSTVKTVSLPDSITIIGNKAFYSSAITKITLPKNVTHICDEAFFKCFALTEVKLNDKLESIGDMAFWNSYSISRMEIPVSVTTIGDEAFAHIGVLNEIVFYGNVPQNIGSEILKSSYDDNIPTVIYYAKGTNWPTPTWTNSGKAYKTVEFNTNLINSGYACGYNAVWMYENGTLYITGHGDMWNFDSKESTPWYAYCDNITSVVVGEGITTVGANSFRECHYIESVTLPDTLTSIGDYAFLNSNRIQILRIPENVNRIGQQAFSYIASFKEIYFYGDVPTNWGKYVFLTWGSEYFPTVYYISGKTGWTNGTWTDPNGNTFTSKTFDGTKTNPGLSVTGTFTCQDPKTAVTIKLMQGSSVKYTYTSDTQNGSGAFTKRFIITGIAPGTYDMEISKPGHLSYKITGITVTDKDINLIASDKAYSTITLVAGDVNRDGSVNESDVLVIRMNKNINHAVSEAQNSEADVNGDGVINESDVIVVRLRQNINHTAANCVFGY